MKLDFFKQSCQQSCTEDSFGLVDFKTEKHARISLDEPDKWVARVENPNAVNVTFTAIDGCGDFVSGQLPKKQRICDCILIYSKAIIFVELKDGKENWVPDAKDQMEQSITLFRQHHDLEQMFSKRVAHLCNRQHPYYQHTKKSEMEQFYQTHKVRLNISATIKIK